MSQQRSLLFSPVNYSSVEQALFLSLLFFIPLQTRLVVFGEEPFLEWTGLFLYGTDLLILALLCLWFIQKPRLRISRADLFLGAFLAVGAASAFFAEKPFLGAYQFLKIYEMSLLFYYVEHNFRRYRLRHIAGAIIASGTLQALLASAQFWFQSDIGLRHIEPGPLGAWIRGVANFFSDSGKYIRAYGTFPHPNALAAFLLGVIAVLLHCFIVDRSKSTIKQFNNKTIRKRCLQRFTQPRIVSTLVCGALFLLVFAFFLTFSRAVVIVGSIGLFGFAAWSAFTKRTVWRALAALGVIYALVVTLLWPEIKSRFQFLRREEAVEFRISSSESAWDIMRKYPLLGVGPGNYIPHIRELIKDAPRPSEAFGEGRPRLKPADGLQPVHNIFLLVGSETGFLGLLAFSAFLLYTAARFFLARPDLRTPLLLFLFVMGAFSLVDHYFWTLQQGRLLWWLGWGIMAAYGKK